MLTHTEIAQLLKTALPKWPALLVEGDAVTEDQAAEIILRTDGLWLSTNDHEWEAQVYRLLGVGFDAKRKWNPDFADIERVNEALGGLALEYLQTQRIASSFVGGPYGWIDWEGKLGAECYNIGKWPTAEAVFSEWSMIAHAFPYLRLRAQVCDEEVSVEGRRPLVEFEIDAGLVTIHPPGPMIQAARAANEEAFARRFTDPLAERGCTLDQLRRAIALCGGSHSRKEGVSHG
jgi:hypothetical protein